MDDEKILAELKNLNETLSGIAQEMAIIYQWMREQGAYPRSVRLSADDIHYLSRHRP